MAAARGGREVAAAGGWREVAAALEDGSVKGAAAKTREAADLRSPSFSLVTFYFSLLGALEKAGRKKKSEEE